MVWPVEREDELNERLSESSLELIEACEILPSVHHNPVRLLQAFCTKSKMKMKQLAPK